MFGLPVDYSDEVTEEQVRAIDQLLVDEFSSDDWETVEAEQ